jgi:hypothetical protein
MLGTFCFGSYNPDCSDFHTHSHKRQYSIRVSYFENARLHNWFRHLRKRQIQYNILEKGKEFMRTAKDQNQKSIHILIYIFLFLPTAKYPYGSGHSCGSGRTRFSMTGSPAVRIAWTKFSGTCRCGENTHVRICRLTGSHSNAKTPPPLAFNGCPNESPSVSTATQP